MDNLVSGIPVYLVIPGAAVLIALASFITVKAMREGREISFWPPRIGPRVTAPSADQTSKQPTNIVPSTLTAQPEVKWESVATVFWLGHDLRELLDSLLNYESSKETILRCLSQVNHHAQALGLDSITEPQWMLLHLQDPNAPTTIGVSETVVSRISRLTIEVQSSPQKNWTTKRRNDWARQIREVLDLIGRLASSHKTMP
jgi:hypothetical protein